MAATATDPAAARAAGVLPAATSALVIGAGVAGLKAAADLATKGYDVTILEARDRVGGRVWTLNTPGGPVEMGAQWIHGSSNPIMDLAKAQGWRLLPSSFDTGQNYEAVDATSAKQISQADQADFESLFASLEDYIETRQDGSNSASLQSAITKFKSSKKLTVRRAAGLDMQVESNIVQDYAADPAKLSLNWFDDDDEMAGGDSIVAQGYSAVVDYLVGVVKSKGGKIALGAPVTAITYNSGGVTVTAGGTEYAAPFAIVTLPLGVLKAKTVKFTPKLPGAKANAIAKLGMGTLNKVVLQFPPASSWPDGNWFERMPLQSDKGRWREFFSLRTITRAAGAEQPIIVAFNAGSPAEYPASTSDAALVTAAVNTLRAMFGAANIPEPVQTWVTRWHSDPYSFGSYSSVQPGAKGRERADLAATTAGRLFWAGEATHQRVPATVQGAWLSGAAAAAAAAAAF